MFVLNLSSDTWLIVPVAPILPDTYSLWLRTLIGSATPIPTLPLESTKKPSALFNPALPEKKATLLSAPKLPIPLRRGTLCDCIFTGTFKLLE